VQADKPKPTAFGVFEALFSFPSLFKDGFFVLVGFSCHGLNYT
jgi:hypothetical protein